MTTKMTDAEKKAAAEERKAAKAKAKADAEGGATGAGDGKAAGPNPAAAPKPAPKPQPDNGPMISVRTAGKIKSRRRIGRAFGPEPTLILVDDLSEEEAVALEADPALVIELA